MNVLALTATASKLVFQAATSTLHMRNVAVIATEPNRPNIFLSITNNMEILQVVKDIARAIVNSQEHGPTAFPKTLVFCQKCEHCGIMWTYLRQCLKGAFIQPRGAPSIPGNRIAEIYTRVSTPSMKESVIESFQRPASTLRVVFATIAFGMGLDVQDV